jgi:hypothetical protein
MKGVVMSEKKSFPLLLCLLSLASSVLSLGFLLLWAINLEAAVRLFYAGACVCSRILPDALYGFGLRCSADLSTVSTFVPLLVFAFPAWQGIRALVRYGRTDDSELLWRPYPPHFAFFLVMLGLAGTLYGLMIGLQSSGVEGVAASGVSGEEVQDSVQRLLAGTATAVLSSLVGLVGAFFAARPLAWLFCRSLPLRIAEELPEDLEETVDRLCEGLGRMDRTVREVTRSLEPMPFEKIAKQLEALETQQRELVTGMSRASVALERCADGLSGADAADQKLERLVTEVSSLRADQTAKWDALSNTLAGVGQRLEGVVQAHSTEQIAAGQRMETAVREQAAAQAAVVDAVRELGETTRTGDRQRKEERTVFRKAFAAFLHEEADHG